MKKERSVPPFGLASAWSRAVGFAAVERGPLRIAGRLSGASFWLGRFPAGEWSRWLVGGVEAGRASSSQRSEPRPGEDEHRNDDEVVGLLVRVSEGPLVS